MFIRTVVFFLLHSSIAFCGNCNFNLPYSGLDCNIDLSHKSLNNIKTFLNKKDKFVALTFDDGPSYNVTNSIISVLEDYKSKATFFLLGERINKKTYKIVEKIHKAGHEIGNHSWSHRKLTLLNNEEQFQELEKTNIAIKRVINKELKWFRPPYGCHDNSVIKNANKLNMDSILWTIDSLDWQGDKPEVLIERVTSSLHNGAIILFHDHGNKSNTVQALPQIITILKKSGYKFVTLSEWEKKVCNALKESTLKNYFKSILYG